MSSPQDVPVVFRLFWIAPILAGAMLALSTFQEIQRGEDSAGWTPVEAEITRFGGQRGWFTGQYWGTYRWEFAGREYTGSEVVCCGADWGDYLAQAGNVAVGDRARIYLNPTDPADAVLITGTRTACWYKALAGIGLIVAGVVLRRRIQADVVSDPRRD